MEEKRAYKRKPISLYTDILGPKNLEFMGECLVTDACESGFAIESESNLSAGQKILLKFPLLNNMVFLSGEIVRSDKGFFYPLYGVKILEYDCINFNVFKNYINNPLLQ